MSSRFGQRENTRSSLFSAYDAQTQSQSRSRPASNTTPYSQSDQSNINPYPRTSTGSPFYNSSASSSLQNSTSSPLQTSSSFSSNNKQMNTAALDELESQNESQVSEMMKRVTVLKDITKRIGVEIRDSTALAEKMNDNFGGASVKLKGTMNRMLRMAERTGVGWRVWLGFFAAVGVLFWYVWLF